MPEPGAEPEKPKKDDPLHVIHVANFDNPRPFETRKGAFHGYTYIPLLGWLPPVELNVMLFFLMVTGACGVSIYGHYSRLKARRANLEGLVELRGALARFEGELKREPLSLEELAQRGYVKALPPLDLRPQHGPPLMTTMLDGTNDAGTWNYAAFPSSAAITVNCTHTDSSGKTWSGY